MRSSSSNCCAWNRSLVNCRFIQSPGDVSRNLASCKAVLGATPLLRRMKRLNSRSSDCPQLTQLGFGQRGAGERRWSAAGWHSRRRADRNRSCDRASVALLRPRPTPWPGEPARYISRRAAARKSRTLDSRSRSTQTDVVGDPYTRQNERCLVRQVRSRENRLCGLSLGLRNNLKASLAEVRIQRQSPTNLQLSH